MRGILLPQLLPFVLFPQLYHRHDRQCGQRLRRHHPAGCGAAAPAVHPAVAAAARAVHPPASPHHHRKPHGQVVTAVPAGHGTAAGRHGDLSGAVGLVQGCLYLQLQRRHRCDQLRPQCHRAAGGHLCHLRPAPSHHARQACGEHGHHARRHQAGDLRRKQHGHRLYRPCRERILLDRGRYVPLLRQPDALQKKRVHRHV